MDKVKELNKVLMDIRELHQRLVTHDMELVALDVRFVETGEVTRVEYKTRERVN